MEVKVNLEIAKHKSKAKNHNQPTVIIQCILGAKLKSTIFKTFLFCLFLIHVYLFFKQEIKKMQFYHKTSLAMLILESNKTAYSYLNLRTKLIFN